MNYNLAIFATHPVQYQVPIWRALAKTPGLEVKVYYFSDHSVRGGNDPGFGIPLAWDIPLLDEYEYEFISRTADLGKPNSVGISDITKLLKEGQYDSVLIQGYTMRFERQIIRAAKRLDIKVVMRGEYADHGKNRRFFKAFLRDQYLRWFYDHVNAFCYVGVEARRHLLRLKVPENKLFFSPYSVDTTLFDNQRKIYERTSSRVKLGLTDEHFVFLFSGKLIPRKEPLLLLDAIEQLPDREHIALIMLGDGPLKNEVVKRGSAVLGERFLFQGFVNQSELGQYFLASDAFVLPANYETWGLVINEAMQFGLPVVTSDHVNCRDDLVIEEQTGLIFTSGDKNSLTQALHYLVMDRLRAAKMGQNARQHIQRYSTKASVQGLLQATSVTTI